MLFKSGGRNRDITYVIRPREAIVAPNGKITSYSKPLRAEFKDHEFDSEAAQVSYGWTSDERMEVDAYLKAHIDYGRIIYDAAMLEQERDIQGEVFAWCRFVQTADGEAELCGKRTLEGSLYCDRHTMEASEADSLEIHEPMARRRVVGNRA